MCKLTKKPRSIHGVEGGWTGRGNIYEAFATSLFGPVNNQETSPDIVQSKENNARDVCNHAQNTTTMHSRTAAYLWSRKDAALWNIDTTRTM